MAHKPDLIVMMGGQGVGKGTFSKMLMERRDYDHIEVGAILRTMPADSEIGRTIAGGNLVPDELLFDMMRERISNTRDTILDGFPRKLTQAQWLVETYATTHNVHVLYLHVPENVLIARINKRIREGGNRADDANPDVIRRRLELYRTVTMPAIEWLRTAPHIKFSYINADGDVRDNFAEIITALHQDK